MAIRPEGSYTELQTNTISPKSGDTVQIDAATADFTGDITVDGTVDGVDVAAVAAQVTTNTADIATNTADIATNTADIATNTADIATNTADISSLDSRLDTVEAETAETLLLIEEMTVATGGNGSSNRVTIPASGSVTRMSMYVVVSGTPTVVCALRKNGSATGDSISRAGSGAAYADKTESLSAGDDISAYVTVGSGTGNAVVMVCVWGKVG